MAERYGKIPSELSLAAGESVRRNAGDTAFEAYAAGIALGDSIGSSTADQIFYSDSSNELAQSANLVFNGMQFGVGITPSNRVDIKGEGNTSATKSINVVNSDDEVSFAVYDNSNVFLGQSFEVGQVYNDSAVAFSVKSSRTNLFNIYDGSTNLVFTLNQDGRLALNGGALYSTLGIRQQINYYGLGIRQPNGGGNTDAINVHDWLGVEMFSVTKTGGVRSFDATNPQLLLGYDSSNYCKITVSSTGVATFDATGSGATFVFSDDVKVNANAKIKLGASSDYVYAGGVIINDFDDHTTAGTTTETLDSFVFSANSIDTDGDIVELMANGIFASNANQKLTNFKVFGTAVASIDTTQNGGSWKLEVEIVRETSSTCRIIATTWNDATVTTTYTRLTGLSYTGSLTVAVEGRTPTSAGDLTLKSWKGKVY